MQTVRFIPVIIAIAATAAWAQLPPSTLTPTKPHPLDPLKPGTKPVVKPATPTPATPTPAEPAETEPAPAPDLTNAVPNALTADEVAQGWKLLFDGSRLIGMRGVQKSDPLSAGWSISAGELTLPKEVKEMDKVTGGDIATIETFVDFDFRFEWKSTVSANSGIRYLVNTSLGQSPTGLEYQIIDDVHNTIGLKGGALRRSGSLDNVLPVGANAKLRSADPINRRGEPWNEGRIIVQGNHVEHWLNGEKVLEFQLSPLLRATAERNYNREEPMAQRPHAGFGTKTRTPIVIVDQGTEVSFRSLKIRALTPGAVRAPATGGTTAGGTGTKPPNPFLIPPKRTPQK